MSFNFRLKIVLDICLIKIYPWIWVFYPSVREMLEAETGLILLPLS
jgi:hypothetical protein